MIRPTSDYTEMSRMTGLAWFQRLILPKLLRAVKGMLSPFNADLFFSPWNLQCSSPDEWKKCLPRLSSTPHLASLAPKHDPFRRLMQVLWSPGSISTFLVLQSPLALPPRQEDKPLSSSKSFSVLAFSKVLESLGRPLSLCLLPPAGGRSHRSLTPSISSSLLPSARCGLTSRRSAGHSLGSGAYHVCSQCTARSWSQPLFSAHGPCPGDTVPASPPPPGSANPF